MSYARRRDEETAGTGGHRHAQRGGEEVFAVDRRNKTGHFQANTVDLNLGDDIAQFGKISGVDIAEAAGRGAARYGADDGEGQLAITRISVRAHPDPASVTAGITHSAEGSFQSEGITAVDTQGERGGAHGRHFGKHREEIGGRTTRPPDLLRPRVNAGIDPRREDRGKIATFGLGNTVYFANGQAQVGDHRIPGCDGAGGPGDVERNAKPARNIVPGSASNQAERLAGAGLLLHDEIRQSVPTAGHQRVDIGIGQR
ncbi:hypothetical protein PWJ86_08670 [Actinotignum schaalii]|nr:hypothetical protein [Actinotignum schaalii]MDE1537227.1 hypothetical protein [Actinotignum schaalii]MDK7272452.1 hypothetical protein [Actinotignum schaalii]